MNLSTVIKVCLDTNILISAFLYSGNPAKVFDLAVDQKIKVVTSPEILSELARVLHDKFECDENYIKRQLKVIDKVCTIVIPKVEYKALKHDPDNRILEAAVAGKVDYIITGDKKHLLPLKEFKGIPIIMAEQFLTNFI